MMMSQYPEFHTLLAATHYLMTANTTVVSNNATLHC